MCFGEDKLKIKVQTNKPNQAIKTLIVYYYYWNCFVACLACLMEDSPQFISQPAGPKSALEEPIEDLLAQKNQTASPRKAPKTSQNIQNQSPKRTIQKPTPMVKSPIHPSYGDLSPSPTNRPGREAPTNPANLQLRERRGLGLEVTWQAEGLSGNI